MYVYETFEYQIANMLSTTTYKKKFQKNFGQIQTKHQ